jgi:hypothetical protein
MGLGQSPKPFFLASGLALDAPTGKVPARADAHPPWGPRGGIEVSNHDRRHNASSTNARHTSVWGESGSASVGMLPLHAVNSSGWRELQASTVERHGRRRFVC